MNKTTTAIPKIPADTRWVQRAATGDSRCQHASPMASAGKRGRTWGTNFEPLSERMTKGGRTHPNKSHPLELGRQLFRQRRTKSHAITAKTGDHGAQPNHSTGAKNQIGFERP